MTRSFHDKLDLESDYFIEVFNSSLHLFITGQKDFSAVVFYWCTEANCLGISYHASFYLCSFCYSHICFHALYSSISLLCLRFFTFQRWKEFLSSPDFFSLIVPRCFTNQLFPTDLSTPPLDLQCLVWHEWIIASASQVCGGTKTPRSFL